MWVSGASVRLNYSLCLFRHTSLDQDPDYLIISHVNFPLGYELWTEKPLASVTKPDFTPVHRHQRDTKQIFLFLKKKKKKLKSLFTCSLLCALRGLFYPLNCSGCFGSSHIWRGLQHNTWVWRVWVCSAWHYRVAWVQIKGRMQWGPVSHEHDSKKVSNLGTLFMDLHKKRLPDFCWQHFSLPRPTALILLTLAMQFLFPLPS